MKLNSETMFRQIVSNLVHDLWTMRFSNFDKQTIVYFHKIDVIIMQKKNQQQNNTNSCNKLRLI